jgi:hypothetical protein
LKISRADEKYGWIRRIQLQDYLRAIVKIRVLRNESLSFWKFVCMPKRVMFGPPPEEENVLERDHSRSVSSEVSVQTRFANPAGVLSTGSLASASASVASARSGDLLSSSPALAASLESFQREEMAAQAGRFDADKDLESFNESLQLAAREAYLRELYGSRNSKADIDNISNMVRSRSNSEAQTLDAHASPRGGIKLSKVFDDNGEEITPSGTDGNIGRNTTDLGYLASSNARLNTRLTSKDEFGSGAQFSPSGSGAIRAPPVHLAQVNSAWSNAELTSALDAISKEEFDTEVHFTGPRSSGPPSLPSSPNVSLVSGVDMTRNDLNIMPSSSSSGGGGLKAGGIAATSPLPAANSVDAGAAKSKHELPPPGTKHDAQAVSPPPTPGSAEKRGEKEAKRRGSQTSKPKG